LCRNNLDLILKLEAEQYGNHRAAILLYQKKYRECIEFTLADLAISPYNTQNMTALGEAYALSGDPKKAEQTINKLTGLSSVRRVSKCQIASIYLALGKKEIAYHLFEQALKEHDMYIQVMKEFSVSVYRIKDDPQFVNIMERSWIPLP
jgi:tetratricopeptide (TPR) repeat protein